MLSLGSRDPSPHFPISEDKQKYLYNVVFVDNVVHFFERPFVPIALPIP